VPIDASAIEEAINQMAEGLHFQVATHTLEFSGRCEACLSESPAVSA
jgi:Fe2+ or Zn2+ uptake regulation protein